MEFKIAILKLFFIESPINDYYCQYTSFSYSDLSPDVHIYLLSLYESQQLLEQLFFNTKFKILSIL